jgi:drug/metabolite transporter (DMT)-like permease
LGSFDPNLLWVLLYIFGLAARDLASRALPHTITTPFAVVWAMLPMTVAGLVLMPFQGGWQPIDGITSVYYVVLVASICVALWMLTTALRSGEVSAVAPFRYTRILFSLAIAFAVFNERLDFWAWVGAALIIGSGLYAFFRERQLAENAT